MSTDAAISTPAPERAERILRQNSPRNLETPAEALDSFITPTDQFYVRSHFPPPAFDISAFTLAVDGAVKTPLSLSYDEIRSMPAVERVATLECAGNGRIFLQPPVRGLQWALGGASTAEWTGVPLAHLLERAGLEADAVEILFEGADKGTPNEDPKPSQAISYARSLKREKALSRDVLVAYRMNGQDLPVEHGFPLRLIVPGHYAMASVKWLTRIHATRQPFQGYWQTTDYAYWDTEAGHPVRTPLGAMKPKSIIVTPLLGARLAAGETFRIRGLAWTGEATITSVQVGTGRDGWAEATFLDAAKPHAWRRWFFDWKVPDAPGQYVLKSRATDSNGEAQPDAHDPRYGSYVVNQCIGIEVQVEAAR